MRSIALIILGIVVGVGAYHFWPKVILTDRPAKYVLCFGDSADPNQRVSVTNIDTFEKTLGYQNPAVHAPNWSSLTKVLIPGEKAEQVKTATPFPAGPGTVIISHMSVTQETTTIGGKPNTMHVTQKVGLDNIQQVKDVLAAVSLSQDP